MNTKDNLKIIAIMLARGGSEGIPGKNIKELAGKPLIAWVGDEAQKSKYIQRTILSTDYEDIAEVGKKHGLEVLFMRPSNLAEDLTPDPPVIEHAVKWLKENEDYVPDIIVHLRPTGPMVTSKELDEAIELLINNPEADSVRSVQEPPKPPFKMWVVDGEYMTPFIKEVKGPDGNIIKDAHTTPRQLLPKVYQTSADIGILRLNTLLEKKSVIGDKVIPYHLKRETIDIDTPIDFEIARMMIKHRTKP